MFNRSDPRFRRRLNQISQNLESANESAQVGLFSFSQHYLKPCFGSIANGVSSCTAPCLPSREGRSRRNQGYSSRRPELDFDFYDDWEDDENDALLAWGNEEYDENNGLDRAQPTPHNTMNYGSGGDGKASRPRGKGTVLPYDDEADPTTIPKSSMFGFMERLPFRVGPRALRYKPSAADLKDRSRGKKRFVPGADALEEEAHSDQESRPFKGRRRSATSTSGHTIESLSSRGDIFPSDDEEDAVPLDDEFELGLDRRSTGDEASSEKTRRSKRPAGSGETSRTHSSRSLRRQNSSKSQADSLQRSTSSGSDMVIIASLEDLRVEEHRLQRQEEDEIERKREAARRLAMERGFSGKEEVSRMDPEMMQEEPVVSPLCDTDVNPIERIELQPEDLPSPMSEDESLATEHYRPSSGQEEMSTTERSGSEHG